VLLELPPLEDEDELELDDEELEELLLEDEPLDPVEPVLVLPPKLEEPPEELLEELEEDELLVGYCKNK